MARSVGIDPQLLAAMMLACISLVTTRKLAHFLRLGRAEMEAEAHGWLRDVEEASAAD